MGENKPCNCDKGFHIFNEDEAKLIEEFMEQMHQRYFEDQQKEEEKGSEHEALPGA